MYRYPKYENNINDSKRPIFPASQFCSWANKGSAVEVDSLELHCNQMFNFLAESSNLVNLHLDVITLF